MSVRVATSMKLDNAGITALLRGPQGASAQAVHRVGNRVLNNARRLAPVDTGRLRASLTMEMRLENGVPVARVGTNVGYGLFVHEGTGIYAGRPPIRPRTARVLRWPAVNNSGSGNRRYSGGSTAGYIYARQVRGQPAQPFLRLALAATRVG